MLAEAVRACVADGTRLFGFFGAGEGHLPFATADGRFEPVVVEPEKQEKLEGLKKKYSAPIRYTAADLAENPTLADMAIAALDVLSTRGNFWLMVEAGDVDWASHANNIDNCIGAVKSGDAAVRAIFAWIEAHGGWADTAVIVTSDHGHLFVLTDPEAFAKEDRLKPVTNADGRNRPAYPWPRVPASHSSAQVRTPSTPFRWQKSPSVSAGFRSAL